jgi:hypothetical protein
MRRQQEIVAAFAIAGIACRVECGDDIFADLLASRYAEFATDAPPRLSLRVEVTAPPPEEVALRWSGPFARIRGPLGTLEIEGASFSGAFEERSGRGWIVQPPDPAPLETFLTAIYAGALLREGGFLLHAAALRAPEGARVFFGPSESGKTTVAELIGDGVITDEITAIRYQGGRFRVSSVPWRGSPLSAELSGLFRLRKAGATAFTRLTSVAAVRQLLTCVFFSRADGAEIARFLEIAGELVTAVPCHDLSFAPDRAFWDAIPRLGNGGA